LWQTKKRTLKKETGSSREQRKQSKNDAYGGGIKPLYKVAVRVATNLIDKGMIQTSLLLNIIMYYVTLTK